MIRLIISIALTIVYGCASTTSQTQPTCLLQSSSDETGIASYYNDSLHGNITASGEPYNKNDLTAAHESLRFGTKVCVTNLANSLSVIVRINDRGPNYPGRIIDLSRAAAMQVGLINVGITKVRVQVIK